MLEQLIASENPVAREHRLRMEEGHRRLSDATLDALIRFSERVISGEEPIPREIIERQGLPSQATLQIQLEFYRREKRRRMELGGAQDGEQRGSPS